MTSTAVCGSGSAVLARPRPAPADPVARHLVRRRRRDTLGVLVAVFVVTMMIGFVPGAAAAWVVTALSGVALVAYVALLVRLRRMAEEREQKLHYLRPEDSGGWTPTPPLWPVRHERAVRPPVQPGRRRPTEPGIADSVGCGMTSDPMTSETTTLTDGGASPVSGRKGAAHPSLLPRWEAGELAAGELAEYAVQYRAFEAALPAVLTAVVGQLRAEGEPEAAALVEENLADELGRPEPHLALFDRFAGSGRWRRRSGCRGPAAEALVATYFDLVGRRAGRRPGRAGRLRDPGVGHRRRPRPTGCAAGTAWTRRAPSSGTSTRRWTPTTASGPPSALAPAGGGSGGGGRRRSAVRADAWWALLDERQAEAPASAELCSHH